MNKQIIYTKLVNYILPFLIQLRQLIFCLWRTFAKVEYIFLHLHVKSYKINIQSCKHLESCCSTQSSTIAGSKQRVKQMWYCKNKLNFVKLGNSIVVQMSKNIMSFRMRWCLSWPFFDVKKFKISQMLLKRLQLICNHIILYVYVIRHQE